MREHAHQLLDWLDPGRLAAVVHLLEVSLEEESDELSPAGFDGGSPVKAVAHLQETNPEWIEHFENFVADIDPATPVLSDEAMSRSTIYTDRS